jgi:hypothetical protein
MSLGELFKSLRRQGGGIGDRAAVTPLLIRHSCHRRSGSPAVGHRQIWVVGRGSGDQGTQSQGTQGQQNCDSRMKNIFLELKHYTTTDWDFSEMAKPPQAPKANAKTLWPKFSLLSEPVFFIVISVQPDCQFILKSAFAICHFASAKWQGTAFAYGE